MENPTIRLLMEKSVEELKRLLKGSEFPRNLVELALWAKGGQ